MSATETLKATRTTGGRTATGRLFYLDIADGRILSVTPDGSDKKVIVTDCPMPDGIVVDTKRSDWRSCFAAPRGRDSPRGLYPVSSANSRFAAAVE